MNDKTFEKIMREVYRRKETKLSMDDEVWKEFWDKHKGSPIMEDVKEVLEIAEEMEVLK